MKTLSLFILTALAASGVSAQDTTVTYKNYFGFSASRVSGYGLMFGTTANQSITVQGTLGLFRTTLNSFASYGLEFQYNLQNSPTGRIFIGPSLGSFNYAYDLGTVKESSESEFVGGFAMGACLPINGFFQNRLYVSATLYYPVFYKDNSIGVGFGGSLHFLF